MASPRPAQRHWVVAGEGLPLLFAMATCMGALSYLQLPFEPNLAITLMLSAGVIGLAWGLHKWAGSPPTRLGLVLTAGLALGFAAGLTRANTVSGNAITAPAGPLLVEGWVSDMEPGPSGTRLRLRVHAIAGMDKGDVPRSVRLTHRLDLRVSSGRFVRCWAVLRPPPGPAIPADYNFRRSAWFEGLGAVGYVQGRCRGGVLGAPERLSDRLELFLAAKRRQLALYTQSVAGERAGGFAAALVAGDRSLMPVADQEALRQSGLAHLLAISGLHLGIVGGLIYFIVFRLLALIEPLSLRYPVQKVAALTAVAATLVYLLISGASVSTQRAFIMSTVFFGAVLFDRPAISFRSFSIAMMAVVALRPESVVSPGFQMSFAATGVLIAVYESWSRRRRFGRNGWLEQVRFGAASIAVTSLAASAATAPFAIFHFERIAPLGIFANLVAMPIVSVLAVPSAGLAILLAPFGFAHIGLRLFGQSLELILAVAHMAAAAGDALVQPLPAMPPFTLLGCVAGLLAVAALRGWSRLIISPTDRRGSCCLLVHRASSACNLVAFGRGLLGCGSRFVQRCPISGERPARSASAVDRNPSASVSAIQMPLRRCRRQDGAADWRAGADTTVLGACRC